MSASVQLEGQILRILFRDPATYYTVARVQTADEGEITVTGPFLALAEGDRFRMAGEWTRHPKFGRQLAVREQEKIMPRTAAGIEAYLASGLFRGVGKKLARRLVDHFGDETLDILIKEPDRVREVPGIGPAKRRSLAESLGEYAQVQRVALFLQGHGVSLTMTMKIFQRYGENAVELVKADPYRLAREVEGIGFITADEIARKLGADMEAPERLKAAVLYLLNQKADSEGHAFLPAGELITSAMTFLNRSGGQPVRGPRLADAVEVLVEQGFLVRDEGHLIYRRELYDAEEGLAERLRELLERPPGVESAEFEVVIAEVEGELGVVYAPEQREAVRTGLGSSLAVITGGPGTGKSTVLLGLLTALRKRKPDAQVLLAAPTGRAARRMADVTGEEARTIHRLLGYNPQENGFAVDEYSPLEGDLLVVDEFSMVDLNLAAALFAAVPDGMQVLLVGDADQLPSVGVGSVLNDLIGSGVVPVVRLTRIYRQAGESRIVLNAHRINDGQYPDLRSGGDFEFVPRSEPGDLVQYVRDRALSARDAGAPLDQTTVLTPMRKTETGVEALNKVLQEALNPAAPGRPEIRTGLLTFRLGDKVMQRSNNYEKEIFNGSVGVITAIRGDAEDGDSLVVTFEEEQRVEYKREELDQLTLAYACTVHKAQGSEYRGLVMIPLTTQHAPMLQRNLLYTALTRAKELAVIVGTEEAVGRAVRNNRIARRYSRLMARLRGEAGRAPLPPLPDRRQPGRPASGASPAPAPAAAAIYSAARERSDGSTGWAAILVLADGSRQEWSGARRGVSRERLEATAAGMALDVLDLDVKVVLCTLEPPFLAALEQDGPAPDEITLLREALGERVWKGAVVAPDDAMALECLRLATQAQTQAQGEEAAARRAAALGALSDPAGLPELYGLLKFASSRVLQAALRALERIGPDQSALEPLNDLLLREERLEIRRPAEELLKRLLRGPRQGR